MFAALLHCHEKAVGLKHPPDLVPHGLGKKTIIFYLNEMCDAQIVGTS
jgi:hypothetical protein